MSPVPASMAPRKAADGSAPVDHLTQLSVQRLKSSVKPCSPSRPKQMTRCVKSAAESGLPCSACMHVTTKQLNADPLVLVLQAHLDA